MAFTVLYGTESGNSEFIAQDLVAYLEGEGIDAVLANLQDVDPSSLSAEAGPYLVVCSTHGEGELPYSAIAFYDALVEQAPDLTGMRYAMFGLGDMYYAETYSQGSEIIDRKFTELGAVRVGAYGRHDASSIDDGSELALAWAAEVVPALQAEEA